MDKKYKDKLDDCMLDLEKIQSWIDESPKNKFDSKTKYLTAYSVIRSCGVIEQVYKEMIFDFFSSETSPKIKSYLSRTIIESSSNPKIGKITDLLKMFDQTIGQQFSEKTTGTQSKNSLHSLVSNRNTFAHGTDITTSFSEIKNFFKDSQEVLEILNKCLNNEYNS